MSDMEAGLLLSRELSHSQLRAIITANQASLPRYLGTYGEQSVIASITAQQTRLFRQNYQGIILQLNRTHVNTNNYSMHLLITLHLYYRTLGMQVEIKKVLKKALIYIDNPHSDPVLQGVCLNHIASLYKSEGKLWKVARYALKGVEIVQQHLHGAGLSRRQRQEVATLLSVLLIFSKNSLLAIMRQHQNKTLQTYYQFVNYLGYKTCVKYLGRESVFNQFSSTEKYFHLPVFKTENSCKSDRKDHSREVEIINQLEKIHEILKTKQNPEFVVINTSNITEQRVAELSEQSIFINNQIQEVIIQQKSPQQQMVQPPPPPPPPPPPMPLQVKPEPVPQAVNIIEQLFKPFAKQTEISVPKITINQKQISKDTSHHYVPSQPSESQSDTQSLPPIVMAEETISINRWEIKFRLEKQQSQRVGNLHIESSNKRQVSKGVIPEEKLEKILCQINKEDKLPYQCLHEELVEEEFIQYYVKPFLSVGEQGKVALHPHSCGLLPPFQIKFLGQECMVFFNHIRHNLFRTAIAPVYSCKSIYLNVELSTPTMAEYFSFEEETVDFINAIFKSINNAPAASVPLTIKDKYKLCKVTHESALLKYINAVISEFQVSLLTREDETAVNEIIENELLFYKYEEIKKGKLGIYYFIRYLPTINYLDVYLKNNYQTYSIDGRIKSRGNALYKALDFLQDFGIPLKAAKETLFAYLEIVAKKYYLLTFDKPLTDHDSDRYVQNAILDLPITENCFRSQLFKKEGYFIPVTISLLTVNSETPVGIKIIEYDPITCRNRGFFIHIVANEWVRPYRKPAITINNILFQTYINEFPFRSEYFLPEWLEKTGFSILFDKIMDPSSQLCLEHNVNCLVRGNILVKIFNNEDST